MMVAPGGSGAASGYNFSGPVMVTGGGAGEVAVDLVDVAQGDTFTYTQGATAAGVATTLGSIADGIAGGNSTLAGPSGYSLQVIGGKQGVVVASSGALSGGAGGNGGTGGSARVIRGQGGRGGSISNTPATASTSNRRATGGGAVNILFSSNQTDTRGGDISNSANGVYGTAGGGCGGRAADLSSIITTQSSGGGYGGPATDNSVLQSGTGPNAAGARVSASPAYLVPAISSFGLDYFGGGGWTNVAPGPGGGSGAYQSDLLLMSSIFGGVGAASASASPSVDLRTKSAGPGGGSGAAIQEGATAMVIASAAGGTGFLTLIFMQEVV